MTVEVRLLLSDELARMLRSEKGFTHTGSCNLRLDGETLIVTLVDPEGSANGNE